MRLRLCGFVVAMLGLALLAGTVTRHTLIREDINYVHPFDCAGCTSGQTDVTLQAAVTAIGSAVKTLMLTPGTWTISNSLSIPENIHLQIPMGATLSVTSGDTLTLANVTCEGDHTCFTGAGTVTLTEATPILPQWFGATCNGTTDDTAAVNAAIAAASHPDIPLCAGVMAVNGTIAVTKSLTLRGASSFNTELISNSTTLPMITIAAGVSHVTLDTLTLTRSVVAASGANGIEALGGDGFSQHNNLIFNDLFIMNQYNGMALGPCAYCRGSKLTTQSNENHGVSIHYGTNPAGGAVQWQIYDLLTQLNKNAGVSGFNTGTLNGLGPFLTDAHSFGNQFGNYVFIGEPTHHINDLLFVRAVASSSGISGFYLDTYGTGHLLLAPWVEQSGMVDFPVGSSISPTIYVAGETGDGITLVNNERGLNISGGQIWTNADAGIKVASGSPGVSIVGLSIHENGQGTNGTAFQTGIHVDAADTLITGVAFGAPGAQTSYIYYGGTPGRAHVGANSYDSGLAESAWINTSGATSLTQGHPLRGGVTLYSTTKTPVAIKALSGANPTKYLEVSSGIFRMLNNAFSAVLFEVTDDGSPGFPGVDPAPGGSKAACFDAAGRLYRSATGSCPP